MPRNRQRVTLESGPKLDLSRLIPRRAGKAGVTISSTLNYASGEVIRAEVELWDGWGDMDLVHSGQQQRLALTVSPGPSADGSGT